jgi:predicted NUDIX family NTP pyrophosphohydrolase
MAKKSAGVLLYRCHQKIIEFFLVHPGGPFFKNKHAGWWTIPKGEILEDEQPLNAAIRELEEETGYKTNGEFLPLGSVVQKGGKEVLCWAVEGNLNPETIICNTFELEWPPNSGRKQDFAEIDKAGWFDLEQAKKLINERQIYFLDQLNAILADR